MVGHNGRPWTHHEDQLLIQAVHEHGHNTDKWKTIALAVPGRTNKACRKRWLHSLSPSIKKTAWTPEEDKQLIELHEKYQTKWAVIARQIPGRTDDACSKRYREALDPSLKKDEWTEEEDEKLMTCYERIGGKWGQVGHELGRSGLGCRNRWRLLERKKKAATTPKREAHRISNAQAIKQAQELVIEQPDSSYDSSWTWQSPIETPASDGPLSALPDASGSIDQSWYNASTVPQYGMGPTNGLLLEQVLPGQDYGPCAASTDSSLSGPIYESSYQTPPMIQTSRFSYSTSSSLSAALTVQSPSHPSPPYPSPTSTISDSPNPLLTPSFGGMADLVSPHYPAQISTYDVKGALPEQYDYSTYSPDPCQSALAVPPLVASTTDAQPQGLHRPSTPPFTNPLIDPDSDPLPPRHVPALKLHHPVPPFSPTSRAGSGPGLDNAQIGQWMR